MRPDLPARSAFTEGKSLSGQRVTRVAGHLPLGSVPGSSQAPGATLIELPGPRGALMDLIFLLLGEPGLELPVPASTGTPQVPECGGADVDVIGAG